MKLIKAARSPGLGSAKLLAIAVMTALSSSMVMAGNVTWNDIKNDAETTEDVLSYGLGLKAQRYSTLDKINVKTVKSLQAAWSLSYGDERQRGQEAQALVHDGVIYVTASYSRVFAIDAKTGKKLWIYNHRLPEDIRPCCDGNKPWCGYLWR